MRNELRNMFSGFNFQFAEIKMKERCNQNQYVFGGSVITKHICKRDAFSFPKKKLTGY